MSSMRCRSQNRAATALFDTEVQKHASSNGQKPLAACKLEWPKEGRQALSSENAFTGVAAESSPFRAIALRERHGHLQKKMSITVRQR
mmetsp:Transcript_78239/g.135726  ORF Transcript_78239/g.135726 Transcript_78239/m.135726 type:complete len:88 (+) Transcript_78239:110-373(+)